MTPIKTPSPKRRRRKRGPSARDVMAQLAADGDLDGLIEKFTSRDAILTTAEEKRRFIREGLQKHAANHGTDGLIECLLSHVLIYDTEALLRAEVVAHTSLAQTDRQTSDLSAPSPRAIEDLERVARIQEKVVNTAKTITWIRETIARIERENRVAARPLVAPRVRVASASTGIVMRGVARSRVATGGSRELGGGRESIHACR